MKWINSTASTKRLNVTSFNYIDANGKPFGGIIVADNKITWHCENSRGPADSVGQAKRAVEKVVGLEEK